MAEFCQTRPPRKPGAMLMLLRMKGETAEEIAGLTRAVRTSLSSWQVGAQIDWPSYAAGRSRGAPLFLLAAKLLARAGASIPSWLEFSSKPDCIGSCGAWAIGHCGVRYR